MELPLTEMRKTGWNSITGGESGSSVLDMLTSRCLVYSTQGHAKEPVEYTAQSSTEWSRL